MDAQGVPWPGKASLSCPSHSFSIQLASHIDANAQQIKYSKNYLTHGRLGGSPGRGRYPCHVLRTLFLMNWPHTLRPI